MAVLRLFASAREAAGVSSVEIAAATAGEVLDEACRRYGERFTAVLASSKVWVNGEPASPATPVGGPDVVAVLPPVSGGAQVPPPAARPHATPAVVVRGSLALAPEPTSPPRAEP
ncbi:MAG: MoaD/ThiS family protein, partial [Acidimicrobiales bacterium]